MAAISRLRKQSVGVALGVISLPENKSVRHKALRTTRHLRWRRYSSIPLVLAAVPMPFEHVDLIHAFGEKGAQQDEHALHRLAPTNHDVIVNSDRGVCVAISLKKNNTCYAASHDDKCKQKNALTSGDLDQE
jgi:hypothetical protein